MNNQGGHGPAITMRGVRKSFGDNEVLKGIDLTVRPGEVAQPAANIATNTAAAARSGLSMRRESPNR